MTIEKIENTIKKYSNMKLVIVISLVLFDVLLICTVVLNQIFNNTYTLRACLISYALEIFVIIVACIFPLGRSLKNYITDNEYKEMLKFLCSRTDGLTKIQYVDGLILIKRTLDLMVYNHTDRLDDVYKRNLYYLQGIVFLADEKNIVPKRLLNRNYVKSICEILLEQMNESVFHLNEIETIEVEDSEGKLKVTPTEDAIVWLCLSFLIAIVVGKVLISLKPGWYECVDVNLFVRVVYSTGTDFVAIILAAIPLINRVKQ